MNYSCEWGSTRTTCKNGYWVPDSGNSHAFPALEVDKPVRGWSPKHSDVTAEANNNSVESAHDMPCGGVPFPATGGDYLPGPGSVLGAGKSPDDPGTTRPDVYGDTNMSEILFSGNTYGTLSSVPTGTGSEEPANTHVFGNKANL